MFNLIDLIRLKLLVIEVISVRCLEDAMSSYDPFFNLQPGAQQ